MAFDLIFGLTPRDWARGESRSNIGSTAEISAGHALVLGGLVAVTLLVGAHLVRKKLGTHEPMRSAILGKWRESRFQRSPREERAMEEGAEEGAEEETREEKRRSPKAWMKEEGTREEAREEARKEGMREEGAREEERWEKRTMEIPRQSMRQLVYGR